MQMPKDMLEEKSDNASDYEGVIKFCTEFLRYFCNNMNQNQEIVFKNFHGFVENITSEDYFIDLIKAIYSGNRTLCENNSQEIIDLFLALCATFGRRAKFLELLVCLISCEDEFISENQVKVLKL